jgi:hypothetical protein
MNSMSLIDIDTPIGASYVYVSGQLKFNQKTPISSGSIARAMYFQDIFVNATAPIDFMTVYKDYMSRNITTPIQYEKLVMPYRSHVETVIEVDIAVPAYQEIKYILFLCRFFSPLLLTLKMAWIQYLSIFIPCAVVVYLIILFIFKYQIFDAAVVNNLPNPKKFD